MERAKTREAIKLRKVETRLKIELGGLIVKAGMREHDKAALYAGLVELSERLNDTNELSRLRSIGEKLLRS